MSSEPVAGLLDQTPNPPEERAVRKLIVTEFMSLDGVMEAPGGEKTHPNTGWVFPYHDEGSLGYKGEELEEAEAMLLGRVTYEGFAEAWPQREGEFADKMNSMPKYVVSSTLTEPEWANTTVLPSLDEVRELKGSEGGPVMVMGSASLVRALFESDLVDEFRQLVFPVIIGDGLRPFPEETPKRPMELTEHRTFDTGVQLHIFRPAAEAG
jgi:dihydrofolate reductase